MGTPPAIGKGHPGCGRSSSVPPTDGRCWRTSRLAMRGARRPWLASCGRSGTRRRRCGRHRRVPRGTGHRNIRSSRTPVRQATKMPHRRGSRETAACDVKNARVRNAREPPSTFRTVSPQHAGYLTGIAVNSRDTVSALAVCPNCNAVFLALNAPAHVPPLRLTGAASAKCA